MLLSYFTIANIIKNLINHSALIELIDFKPILIYFTNQRIKSPIYWSYSFTSPIKIFSIWFP